MIRVLLAEGNLLIREGLKSLIRNNSGMEVVAECCTSEELTDCLGKVEADVLILDYACEVFKLEDILQAYNSNKNLGILAITECNEKAVLESALRTGLDGHLLKDCDEQEIIDGIKSVAAGDRFFCGKVLDAVREEDLEQDTVSCEPISLSIREQEIIRLIAEGLTNKAIADKLFISAHTVMTHRKNIMAKLGINNTAGIVIYAVKENIISPNRFLFASS